MKSPKGFGKSYFTFSSILAHNVQSIIESQTTIAKKTLRYSSSKDVDSLEDEDPPELLISTVEITTNSKPCHCDCHYKKLTKLAIYLFKFIPRCPYYTTYFAFRRSGVHPPLLLS